ncbi:MAG: 2OG-Fe(II) oxygenase [Hahellaceae bacterium]|nr:2OG-Fe(II) oxygenase [Hahellaceae bacterium]
MHAVSRTGYPLFSYSDLIDSLVLRGYYIAQDFITPYLLKRLRSEAEAFYQEGMTRAGIGRGDLHQQVETVRNDRTHWLNGSTVAQQRFFALAEELKEEVNRALFMGVFDFEAHYAVYEPGNFYKKHRDAFKGSSNRVLTTVFYLNDSWQESWGGKLRVYDDSDQFLCDVIPQGGTAVFFLSEQFPHEVLPAKQCRYSIAGWYRVNSSVGGLVDPSR